jgi:hypothetical protein
LIRGFVCKWGRKGEKGKKGRETRDREKMKKNDENKTEPRSLVLSPQAKEESGLVPCS